MGQSSKKGETYTNNEIDSLEQTRLQLIADEMNAAVLEWNIKDGMFYATSTYERYAISNVEPAELLTNRGSQDLVHAEDIDLLEKFFQETRNLNKRVEATLRFKMVTGEYHWCKLVGIFYRDDEDSLEQAIVIIVDVNEEHERNFMLDSMINSMPCGVGIFTFAETLLCRYYSDGFPKLAGLTREEMDKKIADNTVLSSIIAPADFPKVANAIKELSAKGEPMNLTYRYIHKDGTIRWLHLSATKLREENGFPVYYCVFTNPTEETAQYGEVVENSPLGVYVAEKATRKTLYANESAFLMFGFEAGHQFQGITIEEALGEKGRTPLLNREQIETLTTDKYIEFNVNRNDKFYNVKAKEIVWNGIVSYILYFTDMTSEQSLLSSIPGGVAIYRIKKNGIIATEYISEGLAAISGYTVDEFWNLIKSDAVSNVVLEDRQYVRDKIEEALSGNGMLNAMYRVYTKEHKELLIRVDANIMTTKRLGDDDLAVFYAVHTIVSDESKDIISQQKHLYELINAVPTGIGIFEITDGKAKQVYMNDAFYFMLGAKREDRMQYSNFNILKAVHPDDVYKVKEAVKRLIDGENMASFPYRTEKVDGSVFWVNLTAAVVERKDNFIRVYTSSADYNEVMMAQEESYHVRKTMEVALQSAGVLSWRYDYRTRVITDSATLGEAYNLPNVIENAPETILGLGYIAEESKADFLKMFEDVDEEKTVCSDIMATAIDGKHHAWFRQIYTPVYDEHGNYVDAVGIAIDITQQKNREQQYEEQLQLNKVAAADALSTVVLNLTEDSVISYHNSSSLLEDKKRLTTASDLLGSIMYDEMVDPKERYKFDIISSRENMIKAYETGQNHIEVVFHYFNNKSWVKAIYDMMKNPYTGDIEAITSIYDVTKEIRAEKVISQLTELDYQSLLLIEAATGAAMPYESGHNDENINDLIELQNENDSGMIGAEEFMRKYALPGTEDRVIYENDLNTVKKHLETEDYYEVVYSLKQDGVVDHYRVIYTYLKDDSNYILSGVQRVTEIYDKEMKQKDELAKALFDAESANKAKTAFLSRVSHDMRTPLNGILGLTTLMKDVSDDPRITHDLNELEMSGKYLLELINDTLDMSRIENGKLELHPAVCDGRACFNNVHNLIKPGVKDKKINLEINADKLSFTFLYIDEGRLQQIAMNILGNAIKFTPEGGRISCLAETLAMENGIVTDHFVIEDSGCGMDEEFLPHLFEAFSQENAATTNSKQGTGLGMSITKSIVELMDGEINVISKKGVGTKVDIVLRLPVATNEQVENWRTVLDSHATDYNLHNKRVLLCEDHPLNTKIATRLLEKKDLLVEHAENGRIGVEMFKASEEGYYDAILMDIRMSEMDGIDATKAIRKLERPDAKSIPIIAMTANALADDVRRTREAGMDAHLSKPIVPANLYGALEDFINPEKQYNRKRVLIVDDVEMNRTFVRVALESTYEIFQASSGEEALEMLEKYHGMDVVITDIQMPGMNGDELIRRIRENDNYRHMVVIANTQYDGPGQEEKLLALGANDFIYKAAKPEIIKTRIRNALHSMN